MNRIVRDHYPVSKLPEDLREGLEASEEVRVTIEAAPRSHLGIARQNSEPDQATDASGEVDAGPISRFKHVHRTNYASSDEVVRYVRTLRDEWSNRER